MNPDYYEDNEWDITDKYTPPDRTPEEKLWFAVLSGGIDVLEALVVQDGKRPIAWHVKKEREWFQSKSEETCSFLWICYQLELDQDRILERCQARGLFDEPIDVPALKAARRIRLKEWNETNYLNGNSHKRQPRDLRLYSRESRSAGKGPDRPVRSPRKDRGPAEKPGLERVRQAVPGHGGPRGALGLPGDADPDVRLPQAQGQKERQLGMHPA